MGIEDDSLNEDAGLCGGFPAPAQVLSPPWFVNTPVCRLSSGRTLSQHLQSTRQRGGWTRAFIQEGLKNPHSASFVRIMALFGQRERRSLWRCASRFAGGKRGVQGPWGLESGSFKPQERAVVTPPVLPGSSGKEGESCASLSR